MIKKRMYTIKNKLYLEADYLNDADFKIGQQIKYIIDNEQRSITILPDEAGSNKVVKTTIRRGKNNPQKEVPVIDIRKKEVREFFASCNSVEVSISKGKIVFREKVASRVAAKIKSNVVAITDKLFNRKKTAVAEGQISLAAAGMEGFFNFGDTLFTEGSFEKTIKEKALSMVSLFSGCGMLDKGFLDNGFDIKFAIDKFGQRELKSYHIDTYRHNIGDHIRIGDVLDLTKEDIPEADLVVGGIPCVQFSALNTTNNFRDTTTLTHPLVEQFINVVKWSKAKAFLIENVTRFATVKGGSMIKRLKEALPNFNIIYKNIVASDLGSAQKRERVFVLGMVGKEPSLEIPPMHKITTVREALKDVQKDVQHQLYFKPTEKTLERMSHIPPGGNVNDCPKELLPPNKKFSNFLQRLHPDRQAPTITHVQDDVFWHWEEERYLSVAETKALFSLPRDFEFKGSLTAIFEMLKNGVDYCVSSFLAKTIKKQLQLD